MATDCVVPELGENIDAATVVEVFVGVGDRIESGQSVLSLETDKAEFEMPSEVAGVVSEVLVSAGDEVTVGQAVLRLDAAESPGASSAPAGAAEDEDEPDGGDDVGGAEARSKPGQASRKSGREDSQRPQASSETGRAERRQGREAATQRRDASEPAETATPESADASAGSASKEPRAAAAGPVPAAPSVRRIARELGVDIHDVMATGEGGRITAADVHRFVRGRLGNEPAHKSSATAPAYEPLPDFSRWGAVERVEMSKVRRRTAENMGRAWASIPHVTHHDSADVTELEELRKRHASRFEEAGGKLTMTAVLLAILGRALREFPKFNSSVDMLDSSIVYKDYVHVGVAVDTERGLLVPVVRDVDQKSLVELSKDLRELSEAARGRNIRPDALQGATFTLTNLGGIGGIAFSPLINPPEVAVLGVSRSRLEPVFVDGELQPRLLLPLSLSYDHRVIDGADAARFVRHICESLTAASLPELEDR
jgi:pyruvate dehydrogenase E2 component (dihydrolipoamide acetyltransferase)